MLGQLREELGVAARVLVEVLHAGRAGAVALRDLGHAFGFDLRRRARRLLAELLALVGLGAVAAAGDDKRVCEFRVGKADMQDGKPAHRDADYMRLGAPRSAQYVADVG